jgi:hypothetical protein
MELSRLSSILAMFGAVNIFYAMYRIIQRNLFNTLIPMVTYLILLYSAAILDAKADQLRRSNIALEGMKSDN